MRRKEGRVLIKCVGGGEAGGRAGASGVTHTTHGDQKLMPTERVQRGTAGGPAAPAAPPDAYRVPTEDPPEDRARGVDVKHVAPASGPDRLLAVPHKVQEERASRMIGSRGQCSFIERVSSSSTTYAGKRTTIFDTGRSRRRPHSPALIALDRTGVSIASIRTRAV